MNGEWTRNNQQKANLFAIFRKINLLGNFSRTKEYTIQQIKYNDEENLERIPPMLLKEMIRGNKSQLVATV